jgi:L-ascorbate metabolism protein UlaG (beta-lactamase superfamily)
MKITKFVHSCLLVEMPPPVNRTALFDPGVMSEGALDVDKLEFLDDIIITHNHPDHMSIPLIKKLVAKFPEVRITTTPEAAKQLEAEGIKATTEESTGIVFFDSPHEDVGPVYPQPEEIGVHYLDLLTHPGDSHSFNEAKTILALPMTGPWGAMIKAVNLGFELQPKYIIPIHDWHWSDDARNSTYNDMERLFKDKGITFFKMETGVPVVVEV